MVKAVALNKVYIDDVHIGYALKDETGQVMNVKSDAIIAALRGNQISISNLSITSDNKLVMIETETPDIVQSEIKASEPVSTKSEGVVEVKKDINSNPDLARIHELVDVINNARKVYEQGTDEVMSNFEYDKLYDELLDLETKTGVVLNNSPTINVGYEVVSDLPKKKHDTKMLSLDKTKDRPALVSFLNGKEGVLSWKLDGLTVVLTYDNGVLQEAVTRGNGEIGEVVTPNARTFVNIPNKIPYTGRLVLRGEALISYTDFHKINNSLDAGAELYKNPRNLCSGSVRQLDSSITAQRHVHWYCFDVVSADSANLPKEVDKQLDWVESLGFNVVEHFVVRPDTVLGVVEELSKRVESKNEDKPSDGLVITYRDKQYGKSLGCTTKFPRHSKAFKWQDETAISTVIGVEWQVGRSGVITPVCEFEPVDLEGSTVARASVHNVSIMLDLALGYGDRVEIYKANMIIPQILNNLDMTQTCQIPGNCPCCGEPTEIHQDPMSGVYTLWCTNEHCPARGNQVLKHFVARDAMNIDGISAATLEALTDAGIVTTLASIYHIKDHQDLIVNMPGFGYTSFMKMVNAIEKSRDVKLPNLIYALGIPNVGLSTAKLICKHFKNDLADTATASYAELISIEGIGDTIAQSFVDYFEDDENSDNFMKLCQELRFIQEEVSTSTEMAGVTICVTGDVYIFPNRRAIKELVENLGGKLTGSVSKSTSYLVTNDKLSGSNKNKAAQAYGVPIISEEEFVDKFNLSKYI